MNYHGKITYSLRKFHWTKNPDLSKMKWQFLYCGNVKLFMKDTYNFLVKNKTFLHHYYSSIEFSSMLLHNSHVFLYLIDTNPCIRHLYIFWNIWNLILWREIGKKRSSCSYGSKYGALIFGKIRTTIKNAVPFWNIFFSNWRGKMIWRRRIIRS